MHHSLSQNIVQFCAVGMERENSWQIYIVMLHIFWEGGDRVVDEIRVLYMGNKSHILVPKHSERKGYIPFEERFAPHNIGDSALDFANTKL